MTTTAVTFAAIAVTLHAAHQLGDHILQTDHQAANKPVNSRTGCLALLAHVGSYHLGMAAMLATVIAVLDLNVNFGAVVLGVSFSAITHAFIDLRWPVRWLLNHTGSAAFADRQTPICGMYLADQSLHHACLWISSLLIACIR